MAKGNQKKGRFGINLSRRGWNNVLIYGILLLVILFWRAFPEGPQALRDNLASSEQPDTTPVIAADAELGEVVALFPTVDIVEIGTPDFQLQYSEDGWWMGPTVARDQAAMTHFVARWQGLQVRPTEQAPRGEATEIRIRLSDGRPVIYLALYTRPELLLRVGDDPQVYRVENMTYKQLVGANLPRD